jgi:two-component system nitrogen regulation sensor histidine kinase NtrY
MLLAAVASIPSALVLLLVMLQSNYSIYLTGLVALILLAVVGYCLATIKLRLSYQFRSLTNLLEAMSSGDYSLRGRRQHGVDPLGELVVQINALANVLASQRFAAEESRLLLEKVINQINVAIIAFDAENQVSLANPAALALYDLSAEAMLESDLSTLAAEPLLAAKNDTAVELRFPKRRGRFHIHHDQFREQGSVHQLVFVTDVRVLLRAEERRAWQDLIRVISHEINNSLAPITSISRTLQKSARTRDHAASFGDDLVEGLRVVEDRSISLKSFIQSFSQLSRLAEPTRQPVNMTQLVAAVVPLFEHRQIDCDSTSEVEIQADPVQLEQVLINLLKNADEAMPDTNGVVSLSWELQQGLLEICISDEGNGISNPANLFVPLYTTKEKGSGVGLALCRQIIEAHGGYLSVANRDDRRGCIARIELPA